MLFPRNLSFFSDSSIYSVDLMRFQVKKVVFYEIQKITGSNLNKDTFPNDDFINALLLHQVGKKVDACNRQIIISEDIKQNLRIIGSR